MTAGHVTEAPAAHATIWLDEEIAYDPDTTNPDGYPTYDKGAASGVPYTHPDFGYYIDKKGLVGFITNDVGVVVLSKPVELSKYGELAEVGTVDALKVGADVTFVGYGVQYQVTPKIGGPYYAWTGLRQRLDATANLLSNKYAISNTFMKCGSRQRRHGVWRLRRPSTSGKHKHNLGGYFFRSKLELCRRGILLPSRQAKRLRLD